MVGRGMALVGVRIALVGCRGWVGLLLPGLVRERSERSNHRLEHCGGAVADIDGLGLHLHHLREEPQGKTLP